MKINICAFVLPLLFSLGVFAQPQPGPATDLWKLASQQASAHHFSTLFTAQDVQRHLSTDEGLSAALEWCKQTGVTKVYIETFRDGYQAERGTLENAKQKFRAAGFEVFGCVTTTKIGKPSTGWKGVVSCYTDNPTQDKLQAIFEYAAGLFDEIMIDDFWFTDCACPECEAARQARKVNIGEHAYPVNGDTWEDYRCELMVRLSRERVLGPAKRINPGVRLIIKYPQWYDRFHERGYEIVRETADFDRIWVGTETRDYQDRQWGGTPPYEGYFIMRWLGGFGGPKCGGGWFDSLGTTEPTYIEQARQTVLGGARESMLFSYGGLQRGGAIKDVEALRANVPELLSVASQVHSRQVVGLAAYKPPNSHPEGEARVFDFVGMLGLPLVPCHEFPTNAPAAFFSIHALKDPNFVPALNRFIKAGKSVLLTDGLAQRLTNGMKLDQRNVQILAVKQEPKALLQLGQKELDELRAPLLRPFKTSFRAPNGVALYLFRDGSWVIENFNNEPATVELNTKALTVAARGWSFWWK
ncbi:MAG TPA: hypothetical protein VN578_10450 [Candidatus Binatia bacterium]|jgi:hypothetical protein|nr:hypothetical protein [Candidatus Binatia bacterium]